MKVDFIDPRLNRGKNNKSIIMTIKLKQSCFFIENNGRSIMLSTDV